MSIKMAPEKYQEKTSDLENTFKIFDENGDHFITAEELKSVMKKLGQTLTDEEIDLMIEEADTDGDRRVNYKEFVQLMRKLDL
jgi:Ca2+-binding EF-hand superfamily protein